MMLTGRNALVTGGAHRLGAAIVRALAEAGANVFIHYFSSDGAAGALASELRDTGVGAAVGHADLCDVASAPDLVAQATAELGPISLLVNNASGFPEDTLADTTAEVWQTTLDCTLSAPVFLTQALASALPDDAPGSIVNITDARTRAPYAKHFSYAVAKGGLETFTRAAAVALGPRIRVNAVAPGVVLPPPGEGDDYVERLAQALPLRRAGGAEPVAHAVRSLLENDFITGEVVHVDGGGHLTTAVAPGD
ncbi:MAG: SDR family oxidoreductase [Gaiellaceae bacterium]